MIAGMVLSNLFYVVGAVVAATVVSAFVLLHHRRPKSLEAGIEMFSRELKALEPERRGTSAGSPGSRVVPTEATRSGGPRPATGNGGQRGAGRRGGAPSRERVPEPATVRPVPLPDRQAQAQGQGTMRRGPAVTRLRSTPAAPSPDGLAADGFAVEGLAADGLAEPTTQPTTVAIPRAAESGRDEARAPWPHQEDEPG
jgi:hypothetical protein